MSNNLQVGQIAKCNVWMEHGPQAAVNSHHFHVDSVGGNPSTDQDLSDTLDTAIAALYKGLLSNSANYKGIVTQLIWPLPVSVDVVTTANAAAGTAGVGDLPFQVSGLISWYTSLAGRHGRGRTYVPFPYSGDNQTGAGGIPAASYVTRLATLGTTINNVVNIALGGRSATVSHCLWDRVNHTFVRISSRTARTIWATQRRRGDYGRPNSSPI